MSKCKNFVRTWNLCRKDIIAIMKNCSGEGNIGIIGVELTRNLREKVIGKTSIVSKACLKVKRTSTRLWNGLL